MFIASLLICCLGLLTGFVGEHPSTRKVVAIHSLLIWVHDKDVDMNMNIPFDHLYSEIRSSPTCTPEPAHRFDPRKEH